MFYNKLSPRQYEIYQLLLKTDKDAAKAYLGALIVMEDPNNPDRFPQAAHSLREVTSLISRHISIPQTERDSQKKDSLRKKLEKRFIEQPSLLPEVALNHIITRFKEWNNINQFFVSVSHHSRNPNEREFSQYVSRFESILLKTLRPISVSFPELKKLSDIQDPSKDDVKRLIEIFQHPSQVKYFFKNLTSSDWLLPLKSEGFFKSPPSSIKIEGNIQFPVWPLSRYLITVAKLKPRDVMDIIKNMNDTDNYLVHTDLIRAAIQMPSNIAKEIVPLAKRWLDTPYKTLIPITLAELTFKLSKDDEIESSLELLESLLDLKSTDNEEGISSDKAQPYFEVWHYQQILDNVVPNVFQQVPEKVLELLCDKLSKAISLDYPHGNNNYDGSFIWRPAIEEHPQNTDRLEVKNLLVKAITEGLKDIGRTNKDLFKSCYVLLSKYTFPIFRRLELYFMRIYPNLLHSEIQEIFSEKKYFDDIHLFHEYYHILKELFPKLPPKLQNNVLTWIDELSVLEETSQEPSKKEYETDKTDIQIRYLSAIKGELPLKWKTKWAELVNQYGEPEHPDFLLYIKFGWAEISSPLSKEEIKNMPPHEIVRYLSTWSPSEMLFSPSREELGRCLSDIISDNPTKFLEICHEFKSLHPVYVNYLLHGFKDAIHKGNNFDWEPILSFCKDIVWNAPISDESNEYHYQNIKKSVANLLISGLDSGFIPPSINLKEEIWLIIETLLKCKEPDKICEDKFENSDRDLISIFFNTVRGLAFHALINYALWCNRFLNTAESNTMPNEVKQQLEKMLNAEYELTKTTYAEYGFHLPYLVFLDKKWVEDNLPKIFPEKKEQRKLWIAAWEGYMAYTKFDGTTYELLRSQYKIAINKLQSPNVSMHAKETLSKHLIYAYLVELEHLQSKSNTPSLIALFFNVAPPEIKSHAIWFTGGFLEDLSKTKENTKYANSIMKRIKELWCWRVEEASKAKLEKKEKFITEFSWIGTWFIYGSFEKEWAIKQLYETLELTNGIIKVPDYITEVFQKYIDEYPLLVLKSLLLLIKGDNEDWWISASEEIIYKMIELLCSKEQSKEVIDSINALIEEITKRGYHNFAVFYTQTSP